MLYAIKEDASEKLWSQLDTAYFLRHDVDEIAWHTRLLNYRVDAVEPLVKARLSPAGEGLQVGLSQPVAILLDEDEDVEELASQAGFRFFTSPRTFRKYVKEEIQGQAELQAAED